MVYCLCHAGGLMLTSPVQLGDDCCNKLLLLPPPLLKQPCNVDRGLLRREQAILSNLPSLPPSSRTRRLYWQADDFYFLRVLQ